MTDTTPEELPAIDPEADDQPDHPDEVLESEQRQGFAMYRAIDDLDDNSNGLD